MRKSQEINLNIVVPSGNKIFEDEENTELVKINYLMDNIIKQLIKQEAGDTEILKDLKYLIDDYLSGMHLNDNMFQTIEG